MITLAIETSTPNASLCLADDSGVLFSAGWTAERNHDAHLFPALRQAMEILGERVPSHILVGAGPGSYGGVRVALATAVGVSAVTGAETVCLCSWEPLAEAGVCIVSDARRGGWTLRRPEGEILVLTPQELQQQLDAGMVIDTTESAERMQQSGFAVRRCGLQPTAEGLVTLWKRLSDKEKTERSRAPKEPIYVRPPHITEAKHKPWEIRG